MRAAPQRAFRRLSPVRRALLGSVATGVAGQIALVVTGVIAARALGPTDRGYLALVLLIPGAVYQVGHLGLPTGVTYFVAKHPPSVGVILQRLRNMIVFQVCGLTAIHGLVLVLIVGDEPQRVRDAGMISLGLIAAGFTLEYVLAILQGCQAFTAFNLLRSAPSVLYAVGLLALYIVGDVSLVGVLLVFVGINGLAATIGAVVAWQRLRGPAANVEVETVPSRSEIARFGLKGYLGATSPLEALRIDQLIVALFISPTALGLYVAALAFTNLPRFIGQSIGLVAYPRVASAVDPVTARRSVWRLTALCAGISSPIVLVLIITADDLIPLAFGQQFAGAVVPARILMLAGLLVGIRRVLSDGARGLGRPLLGTSAEISTWLTFLLLLLLLQPSSAQGVARGLVGAAAVGVVLAAALLVRGPTRLSGANRSTQT